MSSTYDVVVAGGSVAGLSFALQAATQGLEVLVLEEDGEIGEPEKCDGLVSLRSLAKYIAPEPSCIQSRVLEGTIHSPAGKSVTLDASSLDVIVIDRSEYEKQLARIALSRGVALRTSSRVLSTSEWEHGIRVKADEEYLARYYVDATGANGIMQRNRSGLIPAAKYELEGDWFQQGRVEVFLDHDRYPGFFSWVIPRGDQLAKVGVAGVGINTFRTLDTFLQDRKSRIVSKIAGPIYVGGAIDEFVSGRTVRVGEAAGQVKPTTAGGILGSVAGGMMAGTWVAEAVTKNDPMLIRNYQREWEAKFGSEYKLMRRLRRMFESVSNDDIEKMVSMLSSERVTNYLSSRDFDFHASALVSALGVKGTLQLAGVLLSLEARQVLSTLVSS